MDELKFKNCILFGGNGFIGSHFANYLLERRIVDEIIIADINPVKPDLWPKTLQQTFSAGKIKYIKLDVRQPLIHPDLPAQVDLIVNLAAVHREPGHKPEEYFATNIPGAENVCAWAEKIDCDRILFTSSIAVYGGNNEVKDEDSLTMPLTPYGISKLTAEKIHIAWQAKNEHRKLLIVRPGVIFGSGERGNVSRMVKAILGRYFVYTGNKSVRKAGGYVKELCNAMGFMLNLQERLGKSFLLFNFTMDPAPTLQEYASAITRVANINRIILDLPFNLLLLASFFTQFVSSSINPTRIRKLLRYNDISAKRLREAEYEYKYTLISGLEDWQKERAEDW